MSHFTIRPVRKEDYAAWRPLWDGYNAFYGREGPTALPEEVTHSTWDRFFDAYEPVHCLVAEAGEGGLLGITHYLFHRSTLAVAPACYLQDLFTAKEARGRGVGGALIDAVSDRARKAGAARLYWHTREENTVARSLYDKVAVRSGAIVYLKQL
ncbi:GNAT family N-acetyltransferase [Ramlibacter albus]|uniref:GNAT family N-acetyltransferase n=1 Tax=Ramlibacter albus TaxID=2079448 RepID=A0A923MFI9_9BURK|nr:GNAT family N-acetyltransferase [Ramlibacter albus]MBC5768329.1 GNAT family N-acetyltransferase [Ramlibacter albus]